MKTNYNCLALCGLLSLKLIAMQPAQQQLAPQHQQLTSLIQANSNNIFGAGSILSSATALFSPSHSAQVHSVLTDIAQVAGGQVPALPNLPQGNPAQATLAQGLQLAQTVENDAATFPSMKGRLIRLALGVCIAGAGAGDLLVKYIYNPNQDANTGQKTTQGVFSAGIDLSIISAGLYQMYLAAVDWDTTTKQNDAKVTTKLVTHHATVAGVQAPAAPALASA